MVTITLNASDWLSISKECIDIPNLTKPTGTQQYKLKDHFTVFADKESHKQSIKAPKGSIFLIPVNLNESNIQCVSVSQKLSCTVNTQKAWGILHVLYDIENKH